MKFSCERCGKKYATAQSPAPGRIYKLKCKACGHLIVLRPSAPAEVAPPASAPQSAPPEGVAAPEAPAVEQLASPPRDPGYVDLFAEAGGPEREGGSEDPPPAPARPDERVASEAAPEASLRQELTGTGVTPRPATPARSTTARIPVIPKPPQHKSSLPLLLVGVGGLVLIGILAFVLLGGWRSAPARREVPAARPAPASAPAPTPPPAAR